MPDDQNMHREFRREANDSQASSPKLERRPSKFGYIVSIGVNLILLWVLNNLLSWNPPILTSDSVAVLGILNISIGTTIAINILWFLYDPAWLRHLGQIVLNILSLLVIYTFYVVFPLDLQGVGRMALTIAIFAAMLGLAIATFIEIVRLFAPQGQQ